MAFSDELSPLSAGADNYKMCKYNTAEHTRQQIQRWTALAENFKEEVSSEIK